MASKAKPKGHHEAFANFFENPTREGLRVVLKENVGELKQLDFKENWPESSSLAKHILGMANSGGGCIVAGVQDESLEPTGLTQLEDKTIIFNGVKNYVPPQLLDHIEVVTFTYSAAEYPQIAGKSFQVLFVDYDKRHLPFVSLRGGSSIRANTIYIRRGPSTEEANHVELQQVINARLETGYSSTKELDLQTHFDQLKILFQQIDRNLIKSSKNNLLGLTVMAIAKLAQSIETEPNPHYPTEDFSAFVVRLIRLKKQRIEQELDVHHVA